MVLSTIIARIDGLPLAASVDDEQLESDLSEYKQQAKVVLRRLTPPAEPKCSIDSGKYVLQSVALLRCRCTVSLCLNDILQLYDIERRGLLDDSGQIITA